MVFSNTLKLGKSSTKIHFAIGVFILLFSSLQYLLWLCDKKATHVSLWHGSHFCLSSMFNPPPLPHHNSLGGFFFVFISFLIIYLASPVFTTNCLFQLPTTCFQPLTCFDQLPPVLTSYHPFWPATTCFDHIPPDFTINCLFWPPTTCFQPLTHFYHLPPVFTTYHLFSPQTTHFKYQPPISTTNCLFWITYHPLQLPTTHFGLQEGNLFYPSTLWTLFMPPWEKVKYW